MYSPTCCWDYNPFYNLLLRLQSFLQLVPLICAPGIVCFVSLAHRLVIPLALFLFPTPLWYTTTHIVVSLWIIAGSPFFCSSGTVRRKLVNKGIHLVCVFSTYTKRRPCYSSTKLANAQLFFAYVFFLFFRAQSYIEFVHKAVTLLMV